MIDKYTGKFTLSRADFQNMGLLSSILFLFVFMTRMQGLVANGPCAFVCAPERANSILGGPLGWFL
jgi:hypothetical protein